MKILSQACKKSFKNADVQDVAKKVINIRVLNEARSIIDTERQSATILLKNFNQISKQIYQMKKLLNSIRV